MINVLDPSTKISDFRAIKNNEPMINQNYANLYHRENSENVCKVSIYLWKHIQINVKNKASSIDSSI